MEDEANFLCGKQDKCQDCGIIVKYGAPMYAMFYFDEKYDATKYAYNLAHELILKRHSNLSYDEIVKN